MTLIVLHTAEVEPDYSLPDSSLDMLARRGAKAASSCIWHASVDADTVRQDHSTELVLNHVRGWNSQTVGIGLATRHDLWSKMPVGHVERLVDNAARVAAWFCRRYDIPPTRLAAYEDARAGRRGLVGHSTLDEARYRDPGTDFPWNQLIERVRRYVHARSIVGLGDRGAQVSAVQGRLTDLGYGDLVGPIDGIAGHRFDAAVRSYEIERGLAATGIWMSAVDVGVERRCGGTERGSRIAIADSVGTGGEDRPDDREQVMERLDALGFLRPGSSLEHCVRLFQAAVTGASSLLSVDGRIDPDGKTIAWLNAVNAPRWMRLPEGSELEGFRCRPQIKRGDDRSWATDWLVENLRSAASSIRISSHEHREPQALRVIGASSLTGGDADGVASPAGLGIALALPSLANSVRSPTVDAREYDRAATRTILKSFWRHGGTDAVYLDDPELADEGLCQRSSAEPDRVVVHIRPPQRVDGPVADP